MSLAYKCLNYKQFFRSNPVRTKMIMICLRMSHSSRFRFRRTYLRKPGFCYCTIVSDNISVPFAAKYDCKSVESNKYEKWESAGYFQPQPEATAGKFSVILPPPNITGTLHLGHALTITIQDILCRWKRMQGYSVVWIPGTDHAGIATQVMVEKKLFSETGLTRHDVGREKFLQLVNEWKTEKINKINDQIKQLGASVDWSRYYFTMDSKQSEAVTEAIIRLFEDGFLYREKFMVNWCCHLQSTISDYEIDHIDIKKPTKLSVPGHDEPVEFGKIVNFAYKVVDSEEEVPVCTTRVETIFGDVAVAVHPSDDRYKHLHGVYVRNPLTQSVMPIIFDKAVKPNFGTGAVKITPAHSKIDHEIGKRHNLPSLTIFNRKGELNEICGEFTGLPRFAARQKVLTKLSKLGLLKKVAHHRVQIPICSRSGDVIEQFLEPQWFIKCNELRRRAIEAVEQGNLGIEPEKRINAYLKWLNPEHDWCVSRQLWWGHQFPLYKIDGGWIAARSETEAKAKARTKLGYESEVFERETDVLDTWFSSALLPFSVFNWPSADENMQKFYPLSLMETGADILNFWVVRMVFMGLYFTRSVPFHKVLLHGMICDSRGRKMSKSLGNVIDFDHVIQGITLEGLNETLETNHKAGLLSAAELQYALKFQKELFPKGITSCGADVLRLTLASLDFKDTKINFDPYMCRINTLFGNKIWQASKFIIGWALNLQLNVDVTPQPQDLWERWLLDRLARTVDVVNDSLGKNEFHVMVEALRNFLHHDLCDVYLEIAKPLLKNGAIDEAQRICSIMLYCLEVFLRLIFPIMPFISEELYSHLPGQELIIWKKAFPRPEEYCTWKHEDVKKIDLVVEVVCSARYIIQVLQYTRTDAQFAVFSDHYSFLQQYVSIMKTLIRCNSVVYLTAIPSRIPGPVSAVENKALVFLILPQTLNQQIIANMKLLEMQMERPQKDLNMRLKNSGKAKNPDEKLKEILSKWSDFQSIAKDFFDHSEQNDSLQPADLITATKFVAEAYEFKELILKTLKEDEVTDAEL